MNPRAKPALRVIVNPRAELKAPVPTPTPDEAAVRAALRDFRGALHRAVLALAAQPYDPAEEDPLVHRARLMRALVVRSDGLGPSDGRYFRTLERCFALTLMAALRKSEVHFPEHLAVLYGDRR